jgi:DNA primase large subunit
MKSPAKQQSGDFADSVAVDDKQRKEREAEDAERICKAQEDKASKRTNESKQSCAHVHNLFHAIALRVKRRLYHCLAQSTSHLHQSF